VGVSEEEIARLIEAGIKQYGLRKSFKTIVASGPNAANPHAEVTQRKIRHGDAVVIDFGVIYRGQHSDMTRTVRVGRLNKKIESIYRVVHNAQRLGISGVKANIKISGYVKSVHDYIRRKGFGKYMLHGLGHGVGIRIHEAPKLSEKNKRILKKNTVITIEPGLYRKGMGGVRVEDMVLITEKGCEVLTI